jgi:cytochrome c556
MTRIALAAVAVVLAFAAVGCGGDDSEPEGSSTTEWANDLCTAVTSWTDALEAEGGALTSSPSVESLQEAASGLESATDNFLDEVRALGEPETEAGTEARAAVEELADTIEAEKQEIRDAVDDASGITGVTSAISAVAASLTAMGEAFEQTFERIEDLDTGGELQQAFEEADACDELVSS